MQHDDYADLVEERFKEKWTEAALDKKYALDFRCKCAKELLAEEDETTQTTLAQQQDAEHEEALARHNGRSDAVTHPDEPDPERRDAYVPLNCLD